MRPGVDRSRAIVVAVPTDPVSIDPGRKDVRRVVIQLPNGNSSGGKSAHASIACTKLKAVPAMPIGTFGPRNSGATAFNMGCARK